MVPIVTKLATSMKNKLTKEQQLDLEIGLQNFSDWDGDLSEDSVAASVHMHFTLAFHKTLFHKYVPGDSD